ENLRAFSVQFKAPVNIGDTISFAATVREQHAEPDRPGWHRASLELTAKVKDQNAVLGSAEISVSGETLGLDETGEQRKPLWVPSAHRAEGSEMYTFQRWLKEHRGVSTTDYSSLHDWSVTEVGDFWGAIWDYFGVIASEQPTGTLVDEKMPGSTWFPGAKLNYAENMLKHAHQRPNDTALIGEHESLPATTLTWKELEDQVAALAQQLRDFGVGPGDTVAAVLPHIPQTVVASLPPHPW